MTNNENIKNSLLKLENSLKLIPAIAGIAYLCGFVVINSYLSKFDFFDESILSAKYLIAGMSYLLLILPLVLIIISNSDYATDNLSKNWIEVLDLLKIILWYSLFFDIITFNSRELTTDNIKISIYSFSFIFLVNFYLTSDAAKNIIRLHKILIII